MKKSKKIAIITSSFIFISGIACGAAVMVGVDAVRNTVSVSADDCYYNGLSYIVNKDDTITITGYMEETDLTNLIIPDEIDGKPVTAIGDNAFYKCINISTAKFGKNVRSVGAYAFAGYRPDFSADVYMNISEVTLPDSLESIGENAFQYTNISKINVPASVSFIPEAVTDNSALTQITVEEGNKKFYSDNGVLYSADKTTLIRCPRKYTESSYSVLDETTTIGNSGFYCCFDLSSIHLGKKVKIIGSYAFAGYRPDFSEDVYMNISEITLPDCIEGIGTNAFQYTNIAKINVPASVYFIPEVFIDNPALAQFIVEDGNEMYYSDNGVLYSADKTKIIRCPRKYIESSYRVLDETTTIRFSAFSCCFGLSSINIGKNVNTIGDYAFAGDKPAFSSDVYMNISEITLPDNVKYIGKDLFECSNIAKINVPASVSSISDVFIDNSALTEISVADGNINYSSDNGVLYSADKSKLIRCPQKISSQTVKILDTVSEMSDKAFNYCKVNNLELGKNISKYSEKPFYEFRGTSVYVPASVSSIPEALYNSFSLSQITVEEGNKTYSSDKGILYSADKSILIKCPRLTTLLTYNVSDKTETILKSAFADTKIQSMIIPSSVASIEKYAFKNSELETIKGSTGSYAQTYARENAYTFISLDDSQTTTPPEVTTTPVVVSTTPQITSPVTAKTSPVTTETTTTTPKSDSHYDVNGDGKVNIMDLLSLKKYLLNNIK